jgi:hypothetical protein
MNQQEVIARAINRRARLSERALEIQQAKDAMRRPHDAVQLRKQFRLSRSDYHRFLRQVQV